MLVLLLVILAGTAAGRAAGGTVRAIACFRLRWLPLLVAALVGQVVLGSLTEHAGIGAVLRATIVVGSDTAVGVVLARNLPGRHRSEQFALCLTGAGWCLNWLPIVADKAMPVSHKALVEAGMASLDVSRGNLGKHVLAATGTGMPHGWLFLGDWIAVPPLRTVLSPGDLVMALGLAVLIAAAMARAQTPREDLAARSNTL